MPDFFAFYASLSSAQASGESKKVRNLNSLRFGLYAWVTTPTEGSAILARSLRSENSFPNLERSFYLYKRESNAFERALEQIKTKIADFEFSIRNSDKIRIMIAANNPWPIEVYLNFDSTLTSIKE